MGNTSNIKTDLPGELMGSSTSVSRIKNVNVFLYIVCDGKAHTRVTKEAKTPKYLYKEKFLVVQIYLQP